LFAPWVGLSVKVWLPFVGMSKTCELFVTMSKTCDLFVRMGIKLVGLCEDECKACIPLVRTRVPHLRTRVKLVCLVRGKVQSLRVLCEDKCLG
jgi:hypothetical protein